MLLQDLRKYIEDQLPGACLPVDLIKIAKNVGFNSYMKKGLNNGFYGPPHRKFSLVVDAECCLDRLYGGFFSDWVCGGQWNRMVQFLSVLIQTIHNNNIEIAVFFNGALEKQRFTEWGEGQMTRKKCINSVLNHISSKGTPPPKIWWVSPAMLRTCLKLALKHHGIPVFCTFEDHHQEVIRFCRENNCHGLLAEDSDYIMFDPPRIFSSRQLKLTYQGSLETKELIADEISKGLKVPRTHFCFLAALLSPSFIEEKHLHEFYRTIIEDYDKDKTEPSAVIEAVSRFVAQRLSRVDPRDVDSAASKVFGGAANGSTRAEKFKLAVKYFVSGSKQAFHRPQPQPLFSIDPRKCLPHNGKMFSLMNDYGSSPYDAGFDEPRRGGRARDLLGSKPPPETNLPRVPLAVLRTCKERHRSGLMSPHIYHILTQGEVKFPAIFQDESSKDLPNFVMFFKPIRQSVYAILFNHHHRSYMASKLKDEGKECSEVSSIQIKEWYFNKYNCYQSPTIVEATPIKWAVPTVQRLWFGSVIDDKKRRLRAFLSCVGSDSPLMLHTGFVPQHMLVMASVLRFIMTMSPVPILRKQELDAFLVTAFSASLADPTYLQDLKIPVITSRGCQLAALFMVGVEMALMANDACGSPVPASMCSPWLFFDGKLFQSTLLEANEARNLVELCNGNMELVKNVERCREAIFESATINFLPPPPNPLMQLNIPGVPPAPLFPSNFRPGPPSNHPRGRPNKRFSGALPPPSRNNNRQLYSRGGQLQVAGVVVGSWGPNFGSSKGQRNWTGNANNNNNGRGGPRYDPGFDYNRLNFGYRQQHYTHNSKNHHHHFSSASSCSTRGRPSVLAKRRQFKPKETLYSNKSRLQQQQQQNQTHKKDEQTNGVSQQPSRHPVQNGFKREQSRDFSPPTYDNSPYNGTNYNDKSDPPNHSTTDPLYNSHNRFNNADISPENQTNLSAFSTYRNGAASPIQSHLLPSNHRQNVYNHATNGYKGPDDGLKVLE